MQFDYIKYFPYKEIRDQQRSAIDFALDAFVNKNKRFVILELGTGVGKSAIAMTIARYMTENCSTENTKGTYFLTTQKILQEQYMTDFAKLGLVSLKSSENYDCSSKKGLTCGDVKRAANIQKTYSSCFKTCKHTCDKEAFTNGPLSTTNYSFFLAASKYTEMMKKRQLLCLDEAHNIDMELSKFVEITFSEKFATQILKVQYPENGTIDDLFKWARDVYKVALVRHVEHLANMIEKFKDIGMKMKDFPKLREYTTLDKHIAKVNRFIEIFDSRDWVVNYCGDFNTTKKLEFKPIVVSKYAEDSVFAYGEKVLLLSATIINKDSFCELLGINKDDVEFLSIDTPFPVEHRPIFYSPVGKMGKNDLENTLPQISKFVDEILKLHKDDKGIIHCHTFKIANYIKKNVKNKRLLLHDSDNKEEMLEKHTNALTPTVFLSPSSTEGLDLRDDLSRFQIICKIPFPFLGDDLVKKKMERFEWWYSYQTAKTVIQSVGRSIRNKDDYATTYIIDSNWDYFYKKNQHLFNDAFEKCMQK